MKPVITKFNDKTGDFEITIPVPFTLKDGIEYVDMVVAGISKYEDTKDYNVFELIRENQELKKQLSNSHQIEVQQKEFIKWLEKETKIIENKLNKYNELVKQGKETDIEYYLSIIDERIFDIYGKILSKYKEITGDKE